MPCPHLQEISKTFNTIRLYNLRVDRDHTPLLDLPALCASMVKVPDGRIGGGASAPILHAAGIVSLA